VNLIAEIEGGNQIANCGKEIPLTFRAGDHHPRGL